MSEPLPTLIMCLQALVSSLEWSCQTARDSWVAMDTGDTRMKELRSIQRRLDVLERDAKNIRHAVMTREAGGDE